MLRNSIAAEHGRHGSMKTGVSNPEYIPCSFSVYE